MLIGLDLDNTIVCYDQVFSREASQRGFVPQGMVCTKSEIRSCLRMANREDQWTLLQGYIYGPGMQSAVAFDGIDHFLSACDKAQHQVAIVSHRTLNPYLGEKYDLHQSAKDWLTKNGLLQNYQSVLSIDSVYLEISKINKLNRIATLGCKYFVDDLPEILEDENFPKTTQAILFDPHAQHLDQDKYISAQSWQDVWEIVEQGM